jgi:predicted RNA binding protein YcfA (HicA-like mRNA interferase family)
MNRRKLLQNLRSYGCKQVRDSGKHEAWENPNVSPPKLAPIPRHRTLKKGTVRGICRQLQVPTPPGL